MAVKKTKSDWWRKYEIGTGDFIRRILLFVVLVYAFFNYRGYIIAATVNNTPIFRFSILSEIEKQAGAQTLDNMINEVLISQKARDSHVEVSQSDIDARVSEFESQYASEEQSFDDLLAMQGMTRKEFERQIKLQITVEKLLEGDVTVTEEEITAYLEQNAEFMPADKSEQELHDLAKGQLSQQKIGARFSTWIEEVKNEAKVTRFVNY